ncbi:hypothetical protein EYF80_043442 [Liparis tanakae]|uniref:Uncharacterized protein n=1 Tax=Liparis tanakae TaxID=230148 RepID=A0A4Z2G0J7_9TELE|nr:hypothetical protein EYF80_043442 [Liparis tanakae]
MAVFTTPLYGPMMKPSLLLLVSFPRKKSVKSCVRSSSRNLGDVVNVSADLLLEGTRRLVDTTSMESASTFRT